MMAGLKINFNKSEIMVINDTENTAQAFAEIFNCQIGYFPIKYLGVPVSPSRLHIVDWFPLMDKNAKKLDVWKRGTMPIAGSSILISSNPNNSPIYHMSLYPLPKSVIAQLDKVRRSSFGREVKLKENITMLSGLKSARAERGVLVLMILQR